MARWMISALVLISIASFNATVHAQNYMPMGTIIAPDGVTVVVVNKNGEQITIQLTNTANQLPAGKYRIESWTIERTDKDGNVWKLTGGHLGKSKIFNIIEGQETKLSIGEPVIPSLSARASDSTYSLVYYLRGRLSEIIEITKNGDRPDPPRLQITNADGSYREALTFAYG